MSELETTRSTQTIKKSPLKMLRNIITPNVEEVLAHNLTKDSPWPQPSPMSALNLPASVIHVPEEERREFLDKVVARYTKTLKINSVSSLLETINSSIIETISDEEFSKQIYNTCFSKLLTKNISAENQEIFFDYINDQHDYYLYPLDSLKHTETYEGMYVESTHSLFVKENDKIKAVAIRIKDQTLTPADADRWELAKLYVMQGSAIVLTACIHPKIHFPVDSINGITKSLLPKDHRIFKLLEPHLYIQLPLNFAVQYINKSISHGDQNEIYTPYPFGKKGFFEQVALGYMGIENKTKYAKYSYPLNPEKISAPYGDFLERYWFEIYNFVCDIISEIDREDPLLQLWANSISNYVPGFPNAQMIKEGDTLERCLTSFIHNCSVSHAVDHYTYSRVPLRFSPLRIRVPFPSKSASFKFEIENTITKEDYIRHKFANMMFFKENNLTLLTDCNYKFTSKKDKFAIKNFKTSLEKLDSSLKNKFIPLNEISASIQY
jgi:hypothetical protein